MQRRISIEYDGLETKIKELSDCSPGCHLVQEQGTRLNKWKHKEDRSLI